jgi:hypothetical protein
MSRRITLCGALIVPLFLSAAVYAGRARAQAEVASLTGGCSGVLKELKSKAES